jgi:tRNA threonylcarbamoyladenosine biosynthesis protein TsaE
MKMTLDNLHTIAKDIIKKAHDAQSDSAVVIALEGDLGVGKTTLTKEIARVLSVEENVISPTFIIMKKYEVIDEKFKYLIHIDAYRLEKSEELFKLGFQELLDDKNNLIIIEWPELVPDCIPKNACKIKLSHTNENTHNIEF